MHATKKYLTSLRHSIYIIVVSTVGVLAADYLYTTFFIKRAISTEADLEKQYRIPNSHYGYGLKPNYSGLGSWGGLHYNVTTNSLGFRDATSRIIPRTSDKQRIVFIGDSFTEGIGLPWADTFIGKVAVARPDLDILNASVASYSPSIYYRKINWLIESGHKLDLLWVFLDISDVQDEAMRSAIGATDGGVRRIDSAQPSVVETDPNKTESRFGAIKRFLHDHLFLTFSGLQGCRMLFARGFAVLGGDPAILRERPWWIGLPRAEWTVKVDERAFLPLGFQKSLEKALDWMDRLHVLAETHGVPLIVAVYPWPNQIFYNDLDSRHVSIWRKWCEGKCRRFVDFFPLVFEAARKAGPFWVDDLFLEHDMHYNERGSAILAGGVLGHLEDLFPVIGLEREKGSRQ